MKFAALLVVVVVAFTGCNVYHLSPTGSDAGPGTQAQPWQTLKQSLPKLRAGDTLVVHGDVYREAIPPLAVAKGTSDAPITVMAAPGEHPIILGYTHLLSPDWWNIQGLVFSYGESLSGTNELVRISGGHDWTFTNNEVEFAHSTAGLHIDDGSSDNRPVGKFTVAQNCIHDTQPTNAENQDHLIYMDDLSGSPNAAGRIERNLLFNATNGRGVKLGPGSSGGPHHVQVFFNTIYNTAQNLVISRQSHDNWLHRNLLQHNLRSYNENIYSFDLSGAGNVATQNAGDSSGGVNGGVLSADPLTVDPIDDGGGNVVVSTGFDSVACSGFHPTNQAAQGYGRFAP